MDFILEAMRERDNGDNPLKADLAAAIEPGNNETPTFTMGSPTVNSDLSEQQECAVVANADPYPVVLRTDKATNIRLDDALGTDDINGDDPQADGETSPPGISTVDWIDDNARQQGLVLHDIMSQIHSLDDVEAAVERVCTRKGLGPDQRDCFKQLLGKFLNGRDDKIARWFADDATAYIEQPIYLPEQGKVRRPDRVVVYPDGSADVVDYKFTDNEAAVGCDDHQKQVVEYIWYVRQMGFARVRGYICYPMLNRIVPCSTLNNT